MTDTPHARTSDLPGWPCPPRVRDIAKTTNSWGLVLITRDITLNPGIVQDELGRLWANGDVVPRYQRLNDNDANPGAILFWTELGIGAHIRPKSYANLGNLNSYDMPPDQWVPIVAVAEQLPAFVR